MTSVVVTGAAGGVGTRVVERLLARPDVERVVGVDVAPLLVRHPRLEERIVDLSEPGAAGDPDLAAAFDGASALVHLAWRLSDGAGTGHSEPRPVAEANHRALRRVLDAAAKAGAEVVVHLSSATVYGAWEDNKIPLTEDARIRPNPEFSFAVSKAEAERVVAEWADDHPSVAVSVLRPCAVVGTGDRPLYQALGMTATPGADVGGRPVQYIHVDDLASAVITAWERRLAGVYNAAPDSGIPEERARELAGGVASLTLPARMAAWVASAGWALWRRGVPPEARAYAEHPWVISPDRLRSEGWDPEHSSEEALVETDRRLHWSDIPPGKRQTLNLVLIAFAGLAGAAGAVTAWRFLRNRRRRQAQD